MEIKMKQILFICFCVLLCSCCNVNVNKMNYLSTGMSKQEVIQIMGAPESSAAMNNETAFGYKLCYGSFGFRCFYAEYFVLFTDEKVTAYGKLPGETSQKIKVEYEVEAGNG